MKGVKTSTSLQAGDIIKVKSNSIVYSYAGETGDTDADTAYGGDDLGIVQKISGSSVVYKESSGRIRNTVSIGSIDFSANPNFDYVAIGGTGGTGSTDNRTVIEKGLDAFLKIFSVFSSSNSGSTSNNNSSGSGSGGTGSGDDGGDNGGGDEEKTFLQKYGLYGLLLLVIGIVIALIAKKPKQVPQQNVYQPSQFPPQYNAVRV